MQLRVNTEKLIRSLLSSALFRITGNTCVCCPEHWVIRPALFFPSLPLSFHSCFSSLCTGGSHSFDAFQLAECNKQVQSKQAAGCWRRDGWGEHQTRLEFTSTSIKSLFCCLCESMLLFCCIWAHQRGAPSGRSFQAPPTSRGACFSASGGVQVLIALIFLLCCFLLLPLLPPLWTQTWPLDVFKNSPHLARALWERTTPERQNVLRTTTPTYGNVAGRSNLNSLARLVKNYNSPADTPRNRIQTEIWKLHFKIF